ncbi:MAG: DedA family protein [Bacteroidia bacterium]|nr:DedA family protein [Bacteroidia bacterium]
MEEIVAFLSRIDVVWIYFALFFFAWLENIFPPSPSDVLIVAAGSIISLGEGSVLLTLLFATAGSTAGFVTMYSLGKSFGHRVLETGKIKFISPELVAKVHSWFGRYGFWVVIANRFLSGTRAVISFCAGIAEMHFGITVVLSALSALLWNAILIYAGYALGDNWKDIGEYLSTYSRVITVLLTLVVALWAVRAWWKWRKKRNGNGQGNGNA